MLKKRINIIPRNKFEQKVTKYILAKLFRWLILRMNNTDKLSNKAMNGTTGNIGIWTVQMA